ncbi:ABC transporter substrate-binding protein [Paenibacillus tarimensis]
MKNIISSFMAIALVLVLLSGCERSNSDPVITNTENTSNETADNSNNPSADENELIIYTVWPGFYANEEIYERQVGQYLKKKFPDVNFRHIYWDNPGKQYKDLIAAGTIPDLIMENANNFHKHIAEHDLQYDLSDLIKKHNYDTSQLNQAALAVLKNKSPEGEIIGLPFQMSDFVLFYNKDIFDKFGIDYPTNGMTYDQVYELAKQLTRVDGEITYKGYQQHPGLYMTYNQLGLNALSLTEDKAELATPEWTRHVDNLRRFYDIPANQFTSVDHFPKGNMAMSVHVSEKIVQWYDQNNDLNFDIVSMPSYPDSPGVKAMPNLYGMFITKQSPRKDLAFEVMTYLLSEEMQINFAKEGIIGPLKTPAVQEAFGQNLPQMQGKNTDAIFYGENAMPPAARAKGLTYISPHLHEVFSPLIFGESKDSLTALRIVEENTNKAIEVSKAANGG